MFVTDLEVAELLLLALAAGAGAPADEIKEYRISPSSVGVSRKEAIRVLATVERPATCIAQFSEEVLTISCQELTRSEADSVTALGSYSGEDVENWRIHKHAVGSVPKILVVAQRDTLLSTIEAWRTFRRDYRVFCSFASTENDPLVMKQAAEKSAAYAVRLSSPGSAEITFGSELRW